MHFSKKRLEIEFGITHCHLSQLTNLYFQNLYCTQRWTIWIKKEKRLQWECVLSEKRFLVKFGMIMHQIYNFQKYLSNSGKVNTIISFGYSSVIHSEIKLYHILSM